MFYMRGEMKNFKSQHVTGRGVPLPVYLIALFAEILASARFALDSSSEM